MRYVGLGAVDGKLIFSHLSLMNSRSGAGPFEDLGELCHQDREEGLKCCL